MVEVDALVPEDAPDLVHPLKAAHDQLFEIQFCRDSQEQVLIQRVVVSLEGMRHAACRDWHQHWSFDFDEIAPVHKPADNAHCAASHDRNFAGFRVRDQVQVTLTEAGLGVGQPVEFFWQAPKRFRQHLKLANLNCYLAGPRSEHGAFDSQPVAYVQVFEDFVGFAQRVAPKHALNLARSIQQVQEACFAQTAHCGYSSSH